MSNEYNGIVFIGKKDVKVYINAVMSEFRFHDVVRVQAMGVSVSRLIELVSILRNYDVCDIKREWIDKEEDIKALEVSLKRGVILNAEKSSGS